VSRGEFALGGNTFLSPEDSLFVVLPHPSDKDRVAALFLPFSPEALCRGEEQGERNVGGNHIPHRARVPLAGWAGTLPHRGHSRVSRRMKQECPR
jgi:hypothetical protein